MEDVGGDDGAGFVRIGRRVGLADVDDVRRVLHPHEADIGIGLQGGDDLVDALLVEIPQRLAERLDIGFQQNVGVFQPLAGHAVGGQDEEEHEQRRDEDEQGADDDGDEAAFHRMHFHAGCPSACMRSLPMTPLLAFVISSAQPFTKVLNVAEIPIRKSVGDSSLPQR